MLPPLDKLNPQSYNILPPLAARLLHPFTRSEQTTPSLLHHFTPLGSSNLTSCYPLWRNYPLTLATFYPHWQPNSYLFLPPLEKLPPHSCNILPPWQPNSYIILPPLNKLHPHHYTILPSLAAQLLSHFTHLWTNYPLTLTPFKPLGRPTLATFYPL